MMIIKYSARTCLIFMLLLSNYKEQRSSRLITLFTSNVILNSYILMIYKIKCIVI